MMMQLVTKLFSNQFWASRCQHFSYMHENFVTNFGKFVMFHFLWSTFKVLCISCFDFHCLVRSFNVFSTFSYFAYIFLFFKHAFSRTELELTGKPKCPRPNQNNDRNGIDNYAHKWNLLRGYN